MDSSSRSHTAGELLFHCLSCFVRAPCRALFKRRGQQTDAVHQHEKGSSVFSSTTTFTADASDYGVKQVSAVSGSVVFSCSVRLVAVANTRLGQEGAH
jgi:hypothetical protein